MLHDMIRVHYVRLRLRMQLHEAVMRAPQASVETYRPAQL